MDNENEELVKLSYFSNMAKDITSARTLEETIKQVMRHIGKVFSPVNWSLLLKEPKSGNLKFIYATGPGADKIRGIVLEKGQGVAGWVAENNVDLIIKDVSEDERFLGKIDEVSGFKTRSIIAVPLSSRGNVFGVIELINKIDESLFRPIDLHVLKSIADYAAIAIERVYYLTAMRKIALTDALTGLHNRRSFERILDREIEHTRRKGVLFSLLILDIDHFKSINDRYGHAAGDEVLQTVAKILIANTRKVDSCARLGGDEFAVILPDTDDGGAHFVARRILKQTEETNAAGPYPLSVSIGARVVNPKNPEDILNETDKEMYRSKSKGNDETIDEMGDHLQEMLSEEAESEH